MKLSRFTVLLALLMMFSITYAQQEKNVRIKTYLNATYGNDIGDYSLRLAGISTAVSLVRPNGSFHEMELSAINASSVHLEGMGTTTKNYKLYLRYEYARCLNLGQGKSQFYIGVSASPYTDVNVYNRGPQVSSYSTRNFSSGMRFGFVPRFVYNFTDRWAMDINLPYDVIDFNHFVNVIKNPAFTAAQQRTTEFNVDAFESFFRLRAGVSVKL